MARDLTAPERRAGLNLAIWEGVFATIHGALAGGLFVFRYVEYAGGTYIHFALLGAIPPLAALTQLLSAYWLQFLSSRKSFTFITAGIARLSWIPIILLPFLFIKSTILTVFFIIYAVALLIGSMAGNAWTSWMSDLVPSSLQGRFFSRRNLVATFAVYIGLAGGIFLDKSQSISKFINRFIPPTPSLSNDERLQFIALGLLFMVSLFGAVMSQIYLWRQPEPTFTRPDRSRKIKSIFQYIKVTLADKNFRYFIILICIWNIVNSISGPFWMPYRMKYLQMSNTAIGICDYALGPTTAILALLVWGKIIDRFGNKPVMIFTIFVGSFHPLYYIVSTPDFTALIYLDAISSGLMWSGVGVALFKYMLASAPAESKEMYFAVFTVITGLVYVPLLLFAGWFADAFPDVHLGELNLIQIVFLLVSTGRFIFLIPLSRISEPTSKPIEIMLPNLVAQVRETFDLTKLLPFLASKDNNDKLEPK
ncbi:MAG: MFS transporter [Planctomycetes bacterium]|nr:MFS transporter [Planctomycetota bacterium]